MKNTPNTAKGAMRQIEVACTAWVDLLGYGSMLEASSYDVTKTETLDAIDRLAGFQKIVASHSCRYFPTFVINDGAVAYKDLSPRSASVTYDFVRRSYDLFSAINESDKDISGFPGARMVIAAGFRIRRPLDFNSFLNDGKSKSIKTRLSEGLISQLQAINEALKTRNTHDTTPELQGNFAFSKAYVAESSGTKGGLPGANCFMDMSLLKFPPPKWIQFDEIIDWSYKGLSAKFGKIASFDMKAAAASQHQGVLDAFEVARNLSNSPDIEMELKSRRVSRKR